MAKFNEHRKIVAHLEKIKPELSKAVSAMGVLAENHFKMSFKNQGFTDESFTAWKKRKRFRDTYKRGKRNDSGVRSLNVDRAILIGKAGGRLWKSIQSKKVSAFAIKIFTDVEYARIHNDGLMGKAWGKYPFKMPKRQFIGYSGKLNRKIIAKFDAQLKRIFNK